MGSLSVQEPDAVSCQSELDAVVAELGCEAACIAVVNRETETLEGYLAHNFSARAVRQLKVAIGEFSVPEVAAVLGATPIFRENADEDEYLSPMMRLVKEHGFNSALLLPLLSGQGVSGCCRSDLVFSLQCLSCDRYPVQGLLVIGGRGPFWDGDLTRVMPALQRLRDGLARQRSLEQLQRSRQALESQRDWLTAMLDSMEEMVVLVDANNRILRANQRAHELFATSEEDGEGEREMFWKNTLALAAALSASAPGEPSLADLTLVSPRDGRALCCEIVSRQRVFVHDGQPAVVCVLRDVTDLRRATERLQASHQRLRRLTQRSRRVRDRLNLIIRHVGDPIIIADSSHDVLLMNDKAARFLPRTRPGSGDDLDEQQALADANDAKFRQFLDEAVAGGLDTSDTREIELTDVVTREPVTMSVTLGEIEGEEGPASAVIAILHDLTKVRELERRQFERQLYEADKLAATGRLAASIAHEINNPLETIKNSLYLLSRKFEGSDEDRRFVEIANQEIQRVSGIIQEMLGFYRPSLTMAPVDVNALLEDVLMLVDKQLRQHQIVVNRDLSPVAPSVIGHADQLKQVFLNLILNTEDALPSGGRLAIRSWLGTDEDAGGARDMVRIEFSDTGIGIHQEHLPRIFEPFFSTKAEKGTGLGLWVSSGIVQSHNGYISVTSTLGEGATFIVSLPAAERP